MTVTLLDDIFILGPCKGAASHLGMVTSWLDQEMWPFSPAHVPLATPDFYSTGRENKAGGLGGSGPTGEGRHFEQMIPFTTV